MANIQELKQTFVERFGNSGHKIDFFHAPGRLNLIGEHTDYNGGYVFPAALTFGTALLVRKRDDKGLGLASTNFPSRKVLSVESVEDDEADDWINYPKGCVNEILRTGAVFKHGYD